MIFIKVFSLHFCTIRQLMSWKIRVRARQRTRERIERRTQHTRSVGFIAKTSSLSFAIDAEQAIRHYPWPGNVRELENAIERAVILCEGSSISAELLGIDIELDDLEDDFTGLPVQASGLGHEPSEPTEDLSLEDYFQHFVLEHQDHMTETELARKLGISRKCLWERRQRLGIPRRKASGAAAG